MVFFQEKHLHMGEVLLSYKTKFICFIPTVIINSFNLISF